MSLRAVPENKNRSSVNHVEQGPVAAHAPGLQDVLRKQEGPVNLASQINNRHPLESRVQNWEETQHQTRLETYRRIFGAGEPIKRTMELEIVAATDFKPEVLGGPSNVHRDILMNKDTRIDWEDIYTNGLESGVNVRDFHAEMEHSLGL